MKLETVQDYINARQSGKLELNELFIRRDKVFEKDKRVILYKALSNVIDRGFYLNTSDLEEDTTKGYDLLFQYEISKEKNVYDSALLLGDVTFYETLYDFVSGRAVVRINNDVLSKKIAEITGLGYAVSFRRMSEKAKRRLLNAKIFPVVLRTLNDEGKEMYKEF